MAWALARGFLAGERGDGRRGGEGDPGGTPATRGGIGEVELGYFGDVAEEAVDGLAEGAGAFAMDDADAEELAAAALGEVFWQEGGEIGGAEGVEVEFVCDGVVDDGFRIWHGGSMEQISGIVRRNSMGGEGIDETCGIGGSLPR